MFKKFRNSVKNFFSSTDGGTWTSLFGGVGNKAKNWLNWFKISPRLKALDKIASDIAKTKLVHLNEKGEVIENSYAIELLNKPNHLPEFNKYSLFWLTTIHLDLLGEAFWIVDKNKMADDNILVIPPTWVKKIPRKVSDQFYYVTTSDGVMYKVPKEEMVYFKRMDVSEPYKRGSGNAQQIGDELQIDEYMSKHQQLTFKNGAMPPILASMKGSNKDQRDKFSTMWQNKYGGLSNAQKIAVVDGEAINIQILQQSMKDLDFIDSRKFTQDMILEHYMIPKELMGKVDNSNRATITQAQKIYEENGLEPRLIQISDALSNQYLAILGEKGTLVFVDYMTSDKDFDYADADAGWNSAMYTRNEALVIKGKLPVEGGDVYKIASLGVQFIPMTKAVEQTASIPDGFAFKLITDSVEDPRKKLWKAVDDIALSQEEKAVESLAKFFKKQGKRFQAALVDANKALDDFEQMEIDWDEEDDLLKKTLTPIWTTGAAAGMDVVNGAYDFGLSWDVVREEWFAAVDDFGLERAGFINETTKKKLKKEISAGISEGESIAQITERVQRVIGMNETTRANAIARTETHTATVAGTHYSYKAAGISQEEWIATVDGRERDWHGNAMDGQVTGIDEPFISGLGNELMFPGDPSAPAEEVVNCRCAIAPVINV